jgi:ABC-type phosphate/phosphonate transport system ATPase subunit
MPKRSSTDLNQTAFNIVQQSTGQGAEPAKNPAAVALGRLGGLKGGKARAESLSTSQRVAIARRAAKSRWAKLKN